MKEYTYLELNKMIAELEGLPFPEFGDPNYHNWNLLGPLMVKYKVSVFYPVNVISISSEFSGKPPTARVDFESESEIPRAIIMCILKSENII